MTLPTGQDPAQILTDSSPEALVTVLADGAHPLADLVTDAQLEPWARWLDHAEGQISALRAVAPVIAAMPPAHVARQAARLSDRLGMDHATVTDAITSALPEVIARRPSPSTNADIPCDDIGRTARPQAHGNVTGPGTSALTTAVEQPAAQRSPPSLLAVKDRVAGQGFPATANAAGPTAAAAPSGSAHYRRGAPL